jgi:hypothetical protein
MRGIFHFNPVIDDRLKRISVFPAVNSKLSTIDILLETQNTPNHSQRENAFSIFWEVSKEGSHALLGEASTI